MDTVFSNMIDTSYTRLVNIEIYTATKLWIDNKTSIDTLSNNILDTSFTVSTINDRYLTRGPLVLNPSR